MKGKKIANIVFYEFYGEDGARKQACIFYNDGTVKNCMYEEGIDATLELARDKKITSAAQFEGILNKELVHVMSGYDFEKDFQKFVVKEIEPVAEVEDNKNYMTEVSDESLADKIIRETEEDLARQQEDNVDAFDGDTKDISSEAEVVKNKVNDSTSSSDYDNDDDYDYEDDLGEDDELDDIDDDYYDKNGNILFDDELGFKRKKDKKESLIEKFKKQIAKVRNLFTGKRKKVDMEKEATKTNEKKVEKASIKAQIEKDASVKENSSENVNSKDNKKEVKEEVKANIKEVSADKKDNKKQGFFSRHFGKIGKFFKKQRVRFTALMLAVFLGGAGVGNAMASENHDSRSGLFNGFIERLNPSTKDDKDTKDNKDNAEETIALSEQADTNELNNDLYDGYTFEQLQAVNVEETQQKAMQSIHDMLVKFNITFANQHLEAGKDIKAALTFEEMVALQQAYNDYSDQEIDAIFNGMKINAHDLSDAYKNATLQLMGAHVIETRDKAVDMSGILNTEEGKAFYNKYHEMFLQMKEASGQDQIDKVNAFYREIHKDFPISDDIREVGISHSDGRDMIESYKLSITPMVAASEMMYQNLSIDHTLSDKAIAYFNDLGFCNYADEKFENIGIVTTLNEEDNTYPLYRQYEEAIVKELKDQNSYVIDDAHRDLSQLDAFKDAVNNHGHMGLNGYSGETSQSTETYTTVESHTETSTSTRQETKTTTTSDRDEAVSKTSEEEVKAAEDKVREQDEKDNEEARKKAEQEAEAERQKLQEQADEDTKKKEEEVKKDDEDLQQDIDDANKQIDQNNADDDKTNDKPVNESDFGDHNVDFDDEHSDDNGNLDDSVKDLTTDPTNDQTDEPLPDPNQTGVEFEQTYPESPAEVEYPNTPDPVPTDPEPSYSEPIENETPQNVIEYEEPVEETPQACGLELTEEEYIDYIIEKMASEVETYEEGLQYTYKR